MTVGQWFSTSAIYQNYLENFRKTNAFEHMIYMDIGHTNGLEAVTFQRQ